MEATVEDAGEVEAEDESYFRNFPPMLDVRVSANDSKGLVQTN